MNNNSKAVAIIALVVAIVGLGIGFAAFSSTLTISSTAAVNPTNVFTMTITPVSCTRTAGNESASGTVGTASGTSVTGATVSFYEPGDQVTCTYTANNTSPYIAYLTDIKFGTSTNSYTEMITCAVKTDNVATADQATDSLVQSACAGVSATVTAGTGTTTSPATVTKAANTPKTGITGNSIIAQSGQTPGTATITVVYEYASASARADGPFTVAIPTINLMYSTANPSAS